MRLPKLVGHRGYPRQYPENTLAGFEAAIRAGVRYVETDVQLTADLVPVLFHDRDLKRLCGESGRVHELAYVELKRFHAMDPDRFGYKFAAEPIPTLAQFVALLQRYPKVTAFVEIKRIAVQKNGLANVLTRMRRDLKPILPRVVLISYSLDALLAARRQGWARLGVVIDHWKDRKKPIVTEIDPEFLFCDVNGLPRFGKLSFRSATLAVFEVVEAKLALRLARRGVPLIETFACAELREQLELLAAKA
jgi:glycerophosphoryl diester phosphodiesterase